MSLVKTQDTASKAMRYTARADKLPVVMTLEGHEPAIDNIAAHWNISNSYFPDGKQMFSVSRDGTSRRWNLETGKEIKEARDVREQDIRAVAVSRDGRWVTSIAKDPLGDHLGEIKACDVETGVVKTFKGHSLPRQENMMYIDISADNKLLASGAGDSFRIWSWDTGKLLAGPLKIPPYQHVSAVRFSQDSTKLAVRVGSIIKVWDIQARKVLDVTKFGPALARGWSMPTGPGLPLFWTTKDRTIVAAITWHYKSEGDDEDEDYPTNMINELDALTFESVGAPFEDTNEISRLALSLDCALLVSASRDGIKLWEFESRQLLASCDIHYPVCDITFSPNSRQLAYSEFGSLKIYICDIPPNILARIWPEQEAHNVRICPHTSTSFVLMSSYRPLNVNTHSLLINSMYVILFVRLSLLLILRLLA
jgi:WD40 repeat protein